MAGEMFKIIWPDNDYVIKRMQEEVNSCLGEKYWNEFTSNNPFKSGLNEKQMNSAMYNLIKQIDNEADEKKRYTIFTNVKHGLTKEHFTWARDVFLQYNDIDLFAEVIRQESLNEIKGFLERGEYFCGTVTEQTYNYILGIDDILYGKRQGDIITSTALPADVHNFLNTEDESMKRYHLCHCPFARDSIKSGKSVSKTLCNCSLGHILMFWETTLDVKLEGKVVESALGGDLTCKFIINLPDDIIQNYTK